MYTPSSFRETDPDVLFKLIETYNFGVFFSQHNETPQATHLPFLVDRKRGKHGMLIAHFARANKHWRTLDDTQEVLTVFQGPHTYVSPSWYKNRETVPTWNYATVHVYGKPTIIHQPSELRKMAEQLTHFHESQMKSDWSMKEAGSTIDKELKAIVGMEIEITRIEGKFKFNQNRSTEDQQGVIDHLSEKHAPGVKQIMTRNLDK